MAGLHVMAKKYRLPVYMTAPPVGPALGQHGVNIMEFVKAYNAQTESQRGDIIPAQISVYGPETSFAVPEQAVAAHIRALGRRALTAPAAIPASGPRKHRSRTALPC